jgi:hypothetical protein
LDNLKLNSETQEKFHPLIDTVKFFTNDTKMAFGFDKCGIINIRKGQVENQQRKYKDIEEPQLEHEQISRDTTKPAS